MKAEPKTWKSWRTSIFPDRYHLLGRNDPLKVGSQEEVPSVTDILKLASFLKWIMFSFHIGVRGVFGLAGAVRRFIHSFRHFLRVGHLGPTWASLCLLFPLPGSLLPQWISYHSS